MSYGEFEAIRGRPGVPFQGFEAPFGQVEGSFRVVMIIRATVNIFNKIGGLFWESYNMVHLMFGNSDFWFATRTLL